ncbi:DEAD/DEAH box helicase family protein [Lentimicrobium sp. L6]|uniref:DEAD/DEAH box helicase n=1 Tax=Lentimicrobium sp. L6 TaxID=2735916 RepID=UPI0015523039|nr:MULTISPECIES: SNF2-related protein [unclassified Lentimicrobium]NPD86918.1 DEAD/DEAH box helicase family protein [Lentimicrobium sp. L6]
MFGSYLDFAKINTSFKIQNTSKNTISSLKASNTIFKAYQFKPLLKFLSSDNNRILVADEVGLGKTIEAGHIMLELMARRELKNSLIVCPKSLQEKWQLELREKFSFNFKIYESLSELKADIADRNGNVKGIVNYEKIRLPKEKSTKNKKPKKSLYDLIDENNIKFDFLLCDEAHRLRNATTQTHRGLKKFMEVVKSAVFLTATPIMISEENLFNLLKLLDEQKYSDYATFQNQVAMNRPFINALNQVNSNVSYSQIADDLEHAEVTINYSSGEEYQMNYSHTEKIRNVFSDIPLFQKIMKSLKEEKDSAKTRVQLQFDISDMSEMNKIFSRTRKKEVTQDWSQAIREPHTIILELNPEERKDFDKVINQYIDSNSYVDGFGNEKLTQGGALGLVQKKRQVASSVYGYLNSKEDLERGVDFYHDYKDAKFDALLDIVEDVVNKGNNKLIVFALFKKTLNYLNVRLKKAGIVSAIIHGDIDDRVTEIEKFKTHENVKILLSSEVGSEGLDLQFCDAIVNYDLPWNPMVVEQRIGRVDRFGQKSPKVNIYNLLVKDSIQEDIYTRLLDRIGIFRGSIGDLEAILDKDLEKMGNLGVKNIREWFSSLEQELYSKDISKHEREEKIDAIERAIITEKKNLDTISKGLTDTLTNDVYFRNQVNFIKNNHKYVTEKELVNYIRILIRTKLTTLQLETLDEEKLIFQINIPKSSPSVLKNFLTEYQPHHTEQEIIFRHFINSIRDKHSLKLTFSQQTGYENKNLIRINAYHPIIIAGLNYFEAHQIDSNNTFQFAIEANHLSDFELDRGEYFLAVYSSRILKKWINREQKTELLVPILYDISKKQIIKETTVAERFLGEAQLNATAKSGTYRISPEQVSELEYELALYLDDIESAKLEDANMRLETHSKMQIQLKTEFYNNKIVMQKRVIKNSENIIQQAFYEKERKNAERILPAQRKVLENLLEEKENVLRDIDSAKIKYITPKLLSINHITIK